jgi:protein-S-isoprenylcysteine O-methyltransferase Ste14
MRVMKNPFYLMLACSCRLSSIVSFGPCLTLFFLIFTIIMIYYENFQEEERSVASIYEGISARNRR